MEQLWHLAAVRIQGLRLMRPEKSWRPIVTVEVDKHHTYEFCMGCDGQNPNHKDIFRFHDASRLSVLDIKIWRKSQAKKKGKKRNLVASATHTLGELLRRQEVEPKLEIRLQCQAPAKHALATKGKPQNGALLHIRLHPPPSVPHEPLLRLDSDHESEHVYEHDHATSESGYTSDPSYSSESSDTLNEPPSPNEVPQVVQSGLRRRRIRGYAIFSDEEPLSEDCTSDYANEENKTSVVDVLKSDDDLPGIRTETLTVYEREIHISDAPWVSASELPQYAVEEIKVQSLNWAEQIVASFTVYCEMRDAVLDSHYEKVFNRLQQEWTYIGGLLVALAALNTGALSLPANSIFHINPWCQSAIATSSISTGLGIACDTWFLFRYNWADLQTFITRAKDVFGSYFFFSLSARVPALCMVFSGMSLMLFLGLVAFEAWPQAVLVISFLIGLILSLQFLVYSAHWCATKAVHGGRAGSQRIVMAVRRMTGA
ncbi:hypothetical protein APHAL10511_008441 [Amanita phalloides]|nr:hypothetical protein APHAL10511_008441 [Amanita phalloides]